LGGARLYVWQLWARSGREPLETDSDFRGRARGAIAVGDFCRCVVSFWWILRAESDAIQVFALVSEQLFMGDEEAVAGDVYVRSFDHHCERLLGAVEFAAGVSTRRRKDCQRSADTGQPARGNSLFAGAFDPGCGSDRALGFSASGPLLGHHVRD